jgi:hypothetical protein
MRPTTATRHGLVPMLACMLLATGCRLMGAAALVEDDLPAAADRPQRTARTMHVEVLFVRTDEHDAALREELWTYVDEQALGADMGRRLNANGLRAGIVTGHLPQHLADRFAAAGDEAAAGDIVGFDPALSRRHLQLLPGKPSEIVSAANLPSLVVLEQQDGEVCGATYLDATPQLAIRAWPAADGRVRLEVIPEVKHGPVEKSWVGEDGMFRLETGQRRHRMDHLGIDVTVPTGGFLVVAGAGDEAATVGDGILRDHGRGDRASVRLIAIRPLHRGLDPVFAPSDSLGDPDGRSSLNER